MNTNNKSAGDSGSPQELDAWIEWKKACAIARCLPANAQCLCEKASGIYSGQVKKRYQDVKQDIYDLDTEKKDSLAWKMFESYAISISYSERKPELCGKSYKDGMFLNAAANAELNGRNVYANDLWGQFTMMLRSAINNHFGVTGIRVWQGRTSIKLDEVDDAGRSGYDKGIGLDDEESAGSESSFAWCDEIEEHARDLAPRLFQLMPERQRIYVLAQALGIPASDGVAMTAMGVKKSVACGIGKRINKMAVEQVVECHPNETTQVARLIAIATVKHCLPYILDWARSERSCQPLFMLAEGRIASQQDEAEMTK